MTPLPSSIEMSDKRDLKEVFGSFWHTIRYGKPASPTSSPADTTTSPTLVTSRPHSSELATQKSIPLKRKCRQAIGKALRMLGLKRPDGEDVATSSERMTAAKIQQPTLSARVAAWSGEAKFGPVLNIPDDAIIELALDLASKSSDIPKETLADGSDIKVLDRLRGVNNRVFVVQYQEDLKICVRVPACGWKGAWSEKDAKALVTQVRTMQYIRRHTECPIPEILTYDTTFDNAIHAPHVIMTYSEGRSVQDLWFEENGFLPLEERRQNMLRSLAFSVAQLRSLTFDMMGALHFTSDEDNNPIPGPAHLLNFGASRTTSFLEYVDEVEKENEPQRNSEVYFRKVLEEWKREEAESSDEKSNQRRLEKFEDLGTYRLFTMLLDELPFPKSDEAEKFVLSPPDFDSQNILADEHGTVTAILDWDRVETCTRFVGWCRLPEFLQIDFEASSEYAWPQWADTVMSPMDYDKYRADYARYMTEACEGAGDCKYTAKSHIYEAILEAIGRKTAQEGILDVIMAMAVPRTRARLMRQHIGEKGLTPKQEEDIRRRFRELLKC